MIRSASESRFFRAYSAVRFFCRYLGLADSAKAKIFQRFAPQNRPIAPSPHRRFADTPTRRHAVDILATRD
jgi:hypothetical protein